jgi:hypothetical protein
MSTGSICHGLYYKQEASLFLPAEPEEGKSVGFLFEGGGGGGVANAHGKVYFHFFEYPKPV